MASNVLIPRRLGDEQVYHLSGPPQFHSEQRCWEAALGVIDPFVEFAARLNEDDPEWLAWWNATIDLTVQPEHSSPDRESPKFAMTQAKIMPRFRMMTKAQIIIWLESNGVGTATIGKTLKADLVAKAETAWAHMLREGKP